MIYCSLTTTNKYNTTHPQTDIMLTREGNGKAIHYTDALAAELSYLSNNGAGLTEFIEALKNLNKWNILIDRTLANLFHFNVFW